MIICFIRFEICLFGAQNNAVKIKVRQKIKSSENKKKMGKVFVVRNHWLELGAG